MLEKIGLPAKPSQRGNNWVVDSSHCQGCSSQFTFINRKHHCRRCGGLFCNGCTQQRMVLRGQGDSPVRICEPCKKLEEAARFEMRYGHRSRAGKSGSKLTVKHEDEVLNQILGSEGKVSLSSRSASASDMHSSAQQATTSASFSSFQEVSSHNDVEDILRSLTHEQDDNVSDVVTVTPDELRQRALEEKKKYRTLKAEGKPEEALRAFKKGKELERQAGALEISLRKMRKKALSSSHTHELSSVTDDSKESTGENKVLKSRGKDDLATELRELGWSDLDLRDADKKPATMTLEGELSTLIGEVSQTSTRGKDIRGTDKSQVIAHKKKALQLKREGKLVEAKEELKKAKVLEKQIEEQELLGGDDEDSDEEFSSLLRSLNADKHEHLSSGDMDHGLDFGDLSGLTDDIGMDINLEVTEVDMDDPEMTAALKSFGWTEDAEELESQFAPTDSEALLSEIQSLKKEALHQKRAGNTGEALSLLKKAKLLEKDLDSFESKESNSMAPSFVMVQEGSLSKSGGELVNASNPGVLNVDGKKDHQTSKKVSKSKLMIQKELLGLKKRALALRREGKIDEAEEELKKGKVLEKQLEEMDAAPAITQTTFSNKKIDSTVKVDVGDEGEVTDQDMSDPAYLSILKSLGWEDDSHKDLQVVPSKEEETTAAQVISSAATKTNTNIQDIASTKSKSEIQRELLALKRKSLALRRQGAAEEAEEVLKMAKVLEAQLAETEAPLLKEVPFESKGHMENTSNKFSVGNSDPSLQLDSRSSSTVVSSKEEETTAAQVISSAAAKTKTNIQDIASTKSKSEIQRELLGLKRKSLALRRQGAAAEAEEVHKMAKVLEAQLAETGAPLLKEVPFDSKEPMENTSNEFSVENSDAFFQLDSKSSSTVEASSGTGLATLGRPNDVGGANEQSIIYASHSIQANSAQSSVNSLQQDILVHKRKALALKREGKLAEAKEELREAKILEKHLEEDRSQKLLERGMEMNNSQPSSSSSDFLGSNVSSAGKKVASPSSGPKTLSSRDRFKIQQESLSHKRQALKLRREGCTAEADAEFELAKALEAQLEESEAHDSLSSSAAERADDVMVEDFLDPQLLSALKAVGIGDVNSISSGLEIPEPKQVATKIDKAVEERAQLEEQIKAERIKAVNFKRSGKQAEALDALRRAKLLEKKLNSLAAE